MRLISHFSSLQQSTSHNLLIAIDPVNLKRFLGSRRGVPGSGVSQQSQLKLISVCEERSAREHEARESLYRQVYCLLYSRILSVCCDCLTYSILVAHLLWRIQVTDTCTMSNHTGIYDCSTYYCNAGMEATNIPIKFPNYYKIVIILIVLSLTFFTL